MKGNHFNRKLLTGAFVGMITGISVMMFDKNIRKNVAKKTKRFKYWVDGVKQDPQAFMNNVKSGLDQATRSFKEVSNQLQDMLEQIEDVRETSTKIIQTAKEAGEEMKEVGSSLVHVNSNSGISQDERKRDELQKLH